jgi:translation initiation factor IF-3
VRDGEEGEPAHAVVALEEAMAAAKAVGMDLVEVNGNATPPVCRILDYERVRYDIRKRAKEQKKAVNAAQKREVIKELRLTAKIDVHDLKVKMNGAKKFLDAGNRVTFRIMFKKSDGIVLEKRATRGKEIMDNVISMLEDVEVVLKPKMVGANHMTCSLKRSTKKK